MMNDYDVLQKKFHNFRNYVNEIANNKGKLSTFMRLTFDQWLVLAYDNILPHVQNNGIDKAIDEMNDYLGLDKSNGEQQNKIRRYIMCFSDYLSQSDDLKRIADNKKNTPEVQIDEDEDDPYLRALSKLKI